MLIQHNDAYEKGVFCKGICFEGTKKEHQCSQPPAKGSELCTRHKRKKEVAQIAAEMNKKNA